MSNITNLVFFFYAVLVFSAFLFVPPALTVFRFLLEIVHPAKKMVITMQVHKFLATYCDNRSNSSSPYLTVSRFTNFLASSADLHVTNTEP